MADADLESVSVDMRLEGSVQRPLGEVSLTADSVRLSGRDAGAVVARAHTAQGQIRSTWKLRVSARRRLDLSRSNRRGPGPQT